MDDCRKKFGNLHRTIRRNRHLTQEAETDLLGGKISTSQVSRYEKGINLPPTLSVVEDLALALGCTVREKRMLVVFYVLALVQPYGITDLQIVLKELDRVPLT